MKPRDEHNINRLLKVLNQLLWQVNARDGDKTAIRHAIRNFHELDIVKYFVKMPQDETNEQKMTLNQAIETLIEEERNNKEKE